MWLGHCQEESKQAFLKRASLEVNLGQIRFIKHWHTLRPVEREQLLPPGQGAHHKDILLRSEGQGSHVGVGTLVQIKHPHHGPRPDCSLEPCEVWWWGEQEAGACGWAQPLPIPLPENPDGPFTANPWHNFEGAAPQCSEPGWQWGWGITNGSHLPSLSCRRMHSFPCTLEEMGFFAAAFWYKLEKFWGRLVHFGFGLRGSSKCCFPFEV